MPAQAKVGIIGDFNRDNQSHLKTNEALAHSAASRGIDLKTEWLPTETLENGLEEKLSGFDGLWCAPGSPYRSMQGALNAIRFARERSVPFIGTCGGFQHAVIEYARNVLGITDADHEESNPYASKLIISKLVCSVFDKTLTVKIKPGSRAHAFIGRDELHEYYYCNFGLDPAYADAIDLGGLRITGADDNGEARIVELRSHPFFIATLFLPQFSSTESEPHPLILSFLEAATVFSNGRNGMVASA